MEGKWIKESQEQKTVTPRVVEAVEKIKRREEEEEKEVKDVKTEEKEEQDLSLFLLPYRVEQRKGKIDVSKVKDEDLKNENDGDEMLKEQEKSMNIINENRFTDDKKEKERHNENVNITQLESTSSTDSPFPGVSTQARQSFLLNISPFKLYYLSPSTSTSVFCSTSNNHQMSLSKQLHLIIPCASVLAPYSTGGIGLKFNCFFYCIFEYYL
jgi:hypothetical protein